ncbi:TerC family protein [Bacillus massiliigorillae]|uniref:TerC family protein n=1 Tax=Bacillus massiliigorillae TaxID=1243664 RepID=UPI00039A3B9D|nr:TerC family protein [Bacillus massiliigorillae]
MEATILLEYGWVLLVLIGLEGLLAADNAVVLAVMVKHLPPEERRKALFYGLLGAFVFRIGSLFLISYLVNIWQVQAIGAAYLLFIAAHHIYKKYAHKDELYEPQKQGKGSGFWMTVVKVELADIAFAIDSMLAAIVLAKTLPATGWFTVGDIDGGQFIVMFLGGFIGVVIMRFAAHLFVDILQKRPSLETAAFYIVGWVGVKLAVIALAHPSVGVLPHHFPESFGWKVTFWAVLLGIVAIGFFTSREKKTNQEQKGIS